MQSKMIRDMLKLFYSLFARKKVSTLE